MKLIALYLFCVIGFLMFIPFKSISQTSQYDIESFQDVYSELSSYQSVAILTEGSIFWEYEFDLDFNFPFFDSFYTKLIYREEAWGSLTEDQDFAFLLMEFDAYVFDNVIDTSNITSDVRFAHMEANGMQAFVLQYTNVRFFADPYAETHDTYFNFQLWFFENGVIEVHFGDIQIDDNPIYLPGFGFWCYDDEGIDTTGRCGPHMSISNPLDESVAIGLEGAYNDFEIVEDNFAILTVIPPQGWIIRFKPTTVATAEPKTYETLMISPNPANEFVLLPVVDGRVVVFDCTGKIVYTDLSDHNILDVSGLPAGIYYIRIISEDKIYTGKFVRQ
ncbi:MAG TPA: T9SS type A sorting domain-containing protein [Cyclobacteriaceae bacterium]